MLQEGQYERVGEERTRTVDVRIIAASNRDLPREVEAGRFRQDLYYRLNQFPMKVAPLRERKEDIPLLAAHFLDRAIRKLKLPGARLTQAHIARLQSYDWPGNVRELQNMIERALILAQNGVLWFDLPDHPEITAGPPPGPVAAAGDAPVILSDIELRQRERENALAALRKTGWKIHGPGGTAESARTEALDVDLPDEENGTEETAFQHARASRRELRAASVVLGGFQVKLRIQVQSRAYLRRAEANPLNCRINAGLGFPGDHVGNGPLSQGKRLDALFEVFQVAQDRRELEVQVFAGLMSVNLRRGRGRANGDQGILEVP